ncbi:MAG: hypothetical protein IPO09_22100 [Anaeromyxobacter sp.]|nr:hypothetical protein [Anaeromyxobacter sp.]MBL0274543.1 hypothetical protein [Anaeromyxobacter sp.]
MPIPAFLRGILGSPPRPAAPEPRRAALRVRVEPLHDISFGWTGDGPPVDVPVANLSATGMALLRGILPEPSGAAPTFAGLLGLGQRRLPVVLGLVHVSHDVVGCCFVDPGRALVDAINAHLAAELSALEMAPVEADRLPRQDQGAAHWFHGRENCELYYVEQEGVLLRFHLSFLGNFLEGGADQPVRFGVLTRDRALDTERPGDVHWFRMINAEQLATTIRFVSGIPGLEPGHRDAILKLLC